jgi:hypothetical protein
MVRKRMFVWLLSLGVIGIGSISLTREARAGNPCTCSAQVPESCTLCCTDGWNGNVHSCTYACGGASCPPEAPEG